MFWSQPNKLTEKEEVNSTLPQLQILCNLLLSYHHKEWCFGCQGLLRSRKSGTNLSSSFVFPIPLLTPDGLSTGRAPLITPCRFILPSLCWCHSSSFHLSLQHEQSFKISLNLSLLWQLLLTHIIWTDSILSQFVLHDLTKEEGGVLSPSISIFSVAQNSCHWQPSSMSQLLGATNFSSRYPAFEAAARQAEIQQLARKDPRLSLFPDGYKNPGDFTCG